jgi:hypothetical protein
MPLDTLDSTSNYTGRMAEASRRRNPYETTAPQLAREDDIRARSASFRSLMRRLDPYGDQDRLDSLQETYDKDYDLEYRVPMRNRFKRTEEHGDAIAEQDRYFAQEPMREDKERRSFEALRRRYTDPAMVKAEADIERARVQGRTQRDVAGITGDSRERSAAAGAYGDVAGARVLGGDRAAGPQASEELRGRMAQPGKSISIAGPRGLQAFAQERGISLDEAIEYAEEQGYTITR